MRKTINSVNVAGYLYEVKLEKRKVQNADSKNYGVEYISGSISIAVNEEGTNVIPISYTFITPTFGNGNSNRTYGVLESLMNSKDTWLEAGREGAIKLRATPSLELNDWYDAQGNLVSTLRCGGGFLNIVNNLPPENERNTFRADMFITRVARVFADDNNDSDYMRVSGAVFNFRNDLLPVEFILRNEKGFDYMESLQLPYFTGVFGEINNTTIKTQTVQQTAFGDPIVTTSTKSSREYLIVNMNDTPYEIGGEDLTVDEIKEAQGNRETRLAEAKKRAEEYRASKSSTPQTQMPSTQPTDNTVSFGDFDF